MGMSMAGTEDGTKDPKRVPPEPFFRKCFARLLPNRCHHESPLAAGVIAPAGNEPDGDPDERPHWLARYAYPCFSERTANRRREPQSEIGRYQSLVPRQRRVLEQKRRSLQFEHPVLARSGALHCSTRMRVQNQLIAYEVRCAFVHRKGVFMGDRAVIAVMDGSCISADHAVHVWSTEGLRTCKT